MQWERRPCFVREYVWSDDDSQSLMTALITEVLPPVPRPPRNELLDSENLKVINSYSHLFHITTPIQAS